MRDVEKSIRTNGVGRARSEQKPRARFVNHIIFCDVVDAAGRRPWSRALIVYMNTGLGLATIDGVLLCGISVAAQVDRVEVLGAANVVRVDGRVIRRSIGWVGDGCNSELGALDRVARNGYAR